MTLLWPFDELTITGRELVLRPVRDDDLPRLADVFPDDFDLDPSSPPLPDRPPVEDRVRRLAQSIWRHRGCWSVDDWALDFGVWRDGEPIGIQTLEGTAFPRLRTVGTASWLAKPFRGDGFGVQARALVLAFAFEHLYAESAITSAVLTNLASLGVSRHLGYRDNGVSRHDTGDEIVTLRHLILDRADWVADESATVEGLGPVRPFFGMPRRPAPCRGQIASTSSIRMPYSLLARPDRDADDVTSPRLRIVRTFNCGLLLLNDRDTLEIGDAEARDELEIGRGTWTLTLNATPADHPS